MTTQPEVGRKLHAGQQLEAGRASRLSMPGVREGVPTARSARPALTPVRAVQQRPTRVARGLRAPPQLPGGIP